jgi:hypothetical protein
VYKTGSAKVIFVRLPVELDGANSTGFTGTLSVVIEELEFVYCGIVYVELPA